MSPLGNDCEIVSQKAESVLGRWRADSVWSCLCITLAVVNSIFIFIAPWLWRFCVCGRLGMAASANQLVYFSSLIAVMFLLNCKCYDRATLRSPSRTLHAVLFAWSFATVAIVLVQISDGHSFNEILSGAWVTQCWLLTGAVVVLLHFTMVKIIGSLAAHGKLYEQVVIVGADGERAASFIRRLKIISDNEINILGLFDDRRMRVSDWVEGIPVLGNTNYLLSYARTHPIDRVIFALPWSAERRLADLIEKLRQLPVRIDLLPENLVWRFQADICYVVGIPVATVANQRVAAQLGILKRVEDIAIALPLLIIFAPLFFLVAVAIKLSSPGPVLFRQERYGFNNEVFNVYKFRSMYVTRNDAPVVAASKGDARVTKVGRFLRRTSLDELPQLFNVVNGTMSIVGPRPHAISHNVYFGKIVNGYFARHNVKPGITGWAQVNGHRGEINTMEKLKTRIEHDLYYIDHWSIYFDLKVVLITVFKVWFQKNAY